MSLGHVIRFVLAGLAALAHRPAAADVTPGRVAVEWPASDFEFPPGPGVDLVRATCTACHSPGMILTQPALTKATWLAEVNKMRTVYKAPVADEDIDPIAAYLASLSATP